MAELRGLLAAGTAGYLSGATAVQAALSRRLRPAPVWPGLGVPLIVAIALDLRPPWTVALMAVVLVAVQPFDPPRRRSRLRDIVSGGCPCRSTRRFTAGPF
jgi:hypothetical protein